MKEKSISAIGYIVGMILITAPFLFLAFYTFPVADDYNYGSEAYHVWVLEHNRNIKSFVSLLRNSIQVTYDNWRYERGEYISFLFSCMMPSAFGNHTTWLNAWIIIGAVSYGLYAYVKIVFQKWMQVSKKSVWFIYLMLLACVIGYMPSIAQSFYWFNGGFYNIFVLSIGIVYIMNCAWSVMKEESISLARQAIICIQAFVIGGGNYATILLLGIVIMLFLLYKIVLFRRIGRAWISYFVPFCAFVALNLLAPCNMHRGELAGYSYFQTIIMSLGKVPEIVLPWILETPLIIVLCVIGIMVLTMGRNDENQHKKSVKINPLIYWGLTYCLIAAMVCPVLYAQGHLGNGRVYNVYYLAFVCMIIIDWIYSMFWVKNKLKKCRFISCQTGKWGLSIAVCMLTMGLIYIMVFVEGNSRLQVSNYRTAYKYIVDGNAQKYRDEMDARLAVYADTKEKNPVFPALSDDFSMLIYYDITEDEKDWINETVAHYYGKDSVKLKSK